ncbi:hypothetical protein TOTORO_01630 [Serratia phage vB_SmaS-Totoro]|nr:hypothetical protein TOTORO_01630 [Serratia phage vB_SmaS-Totoro]
MRTISYYSAMDQSPAKFKRASHTLSFLSFKTTVPFRIINRLTLKNAIKLAKKEGYNPDKDWREYPCKWHLRPDYELEQCACEPPCKGTK